MKLKKIWGLGLMVVTLGASAQVDTDTDWKESEAPPPPAFNKEQLISIEMPSYVSLRFGLDPATLTLTPEGIVRYVMIASNATGSVNAMYEGIRCTTWEVKTYARYTASGQWSSVVDPKWHDLNDNLPSKHAMALARQGVCDGLSVSASSATAIVARLKNPKHSQNR